MSSKQVGRQAQIEVSVESQEPIDETVEETVKNPPQQTQTKPVTKTYTSREQPATNSRSAVYHGQREQSQRQTRSRRNLNSRERNYNSRDRPNSRNSRRDSRESDERPFSSRFLSMFSSRVFRAAKQADLPDQLSGLVFFTSEVSAYDHDKIPIRYRPALLGDSFSLTQEQIDHIREYLSKGSEEVVENNQ